MTVADAPPWARELLVNGRVARLGLLDESDRPRVLPVTFALLGETLWSAIDHKPKSGTPARVARLRRRPEASLVVDHYEEDWDGLAWVQVLGRVGIAEAGERRDVVEALREKYPQYAEVPPDGELLGLAAERVVCWRAADAG